MNKLALHAGLGLLALVFLSADAHSQ